jgi:hypothetical protein
LAWLEDAGEAHPVRHIAPTANPQISGLKMLQADKSIEAIGQRLGTARLGQAHYFAELHLAPARL